ncbi:mid1-interacting protein 1 isoform X2 [Corvus moneduloides]|uniref:mid1-interacting protein 1 isoform X2 n=1 Tax=Corvus moneduloides TaxID=1196302 RepID=UPI001362218A|nr:mid1-interacting protein 1 isoform X2 [Corvus moneduloides]
MPAAPRSAGTQTKAAQRLPKGCPTSPRDPGLARRGTAAGELSARCWEAATRAWPSARGPCALPARPPAPTGAGARGVRGGGAGVTLAARPAANGRAGRTRAARGARVSPRKGCQSPVSHSPRPGAARGEGPQRCSVTVPLAAIPARGGTGARQRSVAAVALSQGWGARQPPPHCSGSPGDSAPQFLPPAPTRAARASRDARGAGCAPGALPRRGARGGAGAAAARRLYLAWRRGGWHWGTPFCKIRAINTAPGMGARPRAAGNSSGLRTLIVSSRRAQPAAEGGRCR